MTIRERDREEMREELAEAFDRLDDEHADDYLPSSPPPRADHAHQSLSAVFGQCERAGSWAVADRLSIEAWFGEVKLDFRDAEIAADGIVEVSATSFCGQITLRVPRGTEVDMGGVRAFFGEVSIKRAGKKIGDYARSLLTGRDPDDHDDDPDEYDDVPMVLRIKGSAILGAVTVEED